MYSSEKILQEICYLLSLNNGKLNLLKLIKELYLIDRLSIEERDTSLSGDVYFSLPHGPVLSSTLDMLNDLQYKNNNNIWNNFLLSKKSRQDYYPNIILKKEISYDRLSKKDKEYIEKISKSFYSTAPYELEKYTHTLPEWEDPKGSCKKIKFKTIMLALGKSEDEITVAKQEYDDINRLRN